jgi:hypothetical protein
MDNAFAGIVTVGCFSLDQSAVDLGIVPFNALSDQLFGLGRMFASACATSKETNMAKKCASTIQWGACGLLAPDAIQKHGWSLFVFKPQLPQQSGLDSGMVLTCCLTQRNMLQPPIMCLMSTQQHFHEF